MKIFNQNKFKTLVKTLSSFWINLICLGFVIWQTIKCMTKFNENPQGASVSLKKSANLSFPAITVCGSFGKDEYGVELGYNETHLKDVCGFSRYFLSLVFLSTSLQHMIKNRALCSFEVIHSDSQHSADIQLVRNLKLAILFLRCSLSKIT